MNIKTYHKILFFLFNSDEWYINASISYGTGIHPQTVKKYLEDFLDRKMVIIKRSHDGRVASSYRISAQGRKYVEGLGERFREK